MPADEDKSAAGAGQGGGESPRPDASEGGFLEAVDIMPGQGMTREEVEQELLQIHQEDPAGPLMVFLGVASCILLLIAVLGSSWVTGTFTDSSGSSARIQISLWSFTADFTCQAACDQNAAVVNSEVPAFWVFAAPKPNLGALASHCSHKATMDFDGLFCGKAAYILNGTFWMSEAAQASKQISHEAFKSLQTYDRSRFVIFASFAWVVKIMVTAAIPMFWYVYTDPNKKHRLRALSLFSVAPFAGVVGLVAWCVLNPGLQQLGFALGGSEQKYVVQELLPLGWCFWLAALTLIVFKLLAICLAVRLGKMDFRERQLENLLYEKKVDERLASTTVLSYGAAGTASNPTSPMNSTLQSQRSESV